MRKLLLILSIFLTTLLHAQKYEASWESLSTHNIEPEWFKDAKFGIYFHWGVYSVPAFDSEWYPRWMYVPNRENTWGAKVYEHHIATYGKDFNYHDFIPMFTAEHFDAKEWAELFKASGASFAGPVAQHHDGFAMWDSEFNPCNSMTMGPKKDITGDLLAELKKQDMKTIATFHHAKVLQRYADKPSEWVSNDNTSNGDACWNSHYPYDPSLITSTTDDTLKYLYGNIPEDEFNQYWLDQVNEVVDKYAPDMLWFDSWLSQIPTSYLQQMVAHHFNTGAERGQEPIVFSKHTMLPASVGLMDIEQGGKKDISEISWLTDVTLSTGSWCYTNGQNYKPVDLVIKNMIDVWSKNGVVLLNISPRADGIINEEQRKVLTTIGNWISKHDEAVNGTRAYTMFGYGPTVADDGHFGGQSSTVPYIKDDYRFTQSKDKKTLYVFALGLPDANSTLTIENVVDAKNVENLTNVTLLGSDAPLNWSISEDSKLVINTPATSEMDEITTVFKVEFAEAHVMEPNPKQSGTAYDGAASRAIDGNTNGSYGSGSVTHTPENTMNPWWSWNMEKTEFIEQVKIWNRTDCCGDRLSDFYVFVSEKPFSSNSPDETLADTTVWAFLHKGSVGRNVTIDVNQNAQYIKIQIPGIATLSLAEVEVNPIVDNVGYYDFKEDKHIEVYPNPINTDQFQIVVPNRFCDHQCKIKMSNLMGQNIPIEYSSLGQTYKISILNKLEAGTYIVTISDSQNFISTKFISR